MKGIDTAQDNESNDTIVPLHVWCVHGSDLRAVLPQVPKGGNPCVLLQAAEHRDQAILCPDT